jgi:orotate phosphoribosyltransferase
MTLPIQSSSLASAYEISKRLEDRMFVREFINDNCIVRVEPGSKELPSYLNQGSGYYTWQFYLREAFFDAKILNVIVQDFMSRYEEMLKSGAIQLCGVESASTPLLTGIAIACCNRGFDVNIFSIRKDRKTYGKKNWLEGKVLKNKLAMIIDDIVSETHKTACHAANVLYNQAIPIADHCYAVVHKTDKPENNKIKLLYRELTVGSMFSLNDFDLYLADYLKNKQG